MMNKIVKKLMVLLITVFLLFALSGCSSSNAANGNEIFKLYPTQNIWTFLKLDTRDGQIWQVQYTINDDENRLAVPLNNIPLIDDLGKKAGRFALYPTQNMYNFILLDQIDGRMWQIQWSMEESARGIVDEIK